MKDKELEKLYGKPLSTEEIDRIRKDGGGTEILYSREKFEGSKDHKRRFNPSL